MPDFEKMDKQCSAWQAIDTWPNVKPCTNEVLKGSRHCSEHQDLIARTAESPADGEDVPF